MPINDAFSVEELKKEAREYVDKNLIFPTEDDYLYAENLALLGALLAMKPE